MAILMESGLLRWVVRLVGRRRWWRNRSRLKWGNGLLPRIRNWLLLAWLRRGLLRPEPGANASTESRADTSAGAARTPRSPIVASETACGSRLAAESGSASHRLRTESGGLSHTRRSNSLHTLLRETWIARSHRPGRASGSSAVLAEIVDELPLVVSVVVVVDLDALLLDLAGHPCDAPGDR